MVSACVTVAAGVKGYRVQGFGLGALRAYRSALE